MSQPVLTALLLPLTGCASLHWPWSKDQAAAEEPVVVESDDTVGPPPSVIEPEVGGRWIQAWDNGGALFKDLARYGITIPKCFAQTLAAVL